MFGIRNDNPKSGHHSLWYSSWLVLDSHRDTPARLERIGTPEKSPIMDASFFHCGFEWLKNNVDRGGRDLHGHIEVGLLNSGSFQHADRDPFPQ